MDECGTSHFFFSFFFLIQNDPFDKLLQYFCGKKYLKKEDVLLVYEGIPVMLRATPQSLNMITGVKAKNLISKQW